MRSSGPGRGRPSPSFAEQKTPAVTRGGFPVLPCANALLLLLFLLGGSRALGGSRRRGALRGSRARRGGGALRAGRRRSRGAGRGSRAGRRGRRAFGRGRLFL